MMGQSFHYLVQVAFSTDSYVVNPPFFPGGNIGHLAIHGTINDLAMCGARPRYLSLGLILEEGLTMEELEEILTTIGQSCEAAGVQIVTGDTKVVEQGKGDKIFINTTGIGEVHPRAKIGTEYIQPGNKIIISGSIANHGIAIMSKREGLTFESEVESDTRPLHEPVLSLLDSFGAGVKILRDPTRGGVATVLNELAQQAKLGMNLKEQDIPVEMAVMGACEMLGLDPLMVANEGIFIAIVEGNEAEEMVSLLQSFSETSAACIIGEVTDHHPGQVILSNEMGGRRVLPMLTGEQLPRIC